MEPIENNYLNKEELVKERATSRGGAEDQVIEKSIKKELTKSVVLFSILVLSIAIFAYINYSFEEKFKREFELPGAQVEGI